MSNVTTAQKSTVRQSLLAEAASAFRVSGTVKVKRGAVLTALKSDGLSESQAAQALGRLIGADAPSRATVGFYVRTYALYSAAEADSPALFDTLWSVVTRGKGVSDEQVLAVIVPGDTRATSAAVKALVEQAKAEAKAEAEQAKAEAKTAEAAAEAGAMAAPEVSAPDFGAMVAALIGKATTRDARKRLAAAFAQGIETLNAAERTARKAA